MTLGVLVLVVLAEVQVEVQQRRQRAGDQLLRIFSHPGAEEEFQQEKQQKIAELEAYDQSDAVNGFDVTIGGNTMSLWIDRETRADYRSSIEAAELLGRTEVKPVFGGQEITLDI